MPQLVSFIERYSPLVGGSVMGGSTVSCNGIGVLDIKSLLGHVGEG